MTERSITLGVVGVVILALAFFARSILLDRTAIEWPQSPTWVTRYEKDDGGAPVRVWFDFPWHRLAKTVRVDVRDGVPRRRDGNRDIILELDSFLKAELAQTQSEWILVTASFDERIEPVIAVIDQCRKHPVKAVLINQITGDASEAY
jgi:hypothetical protein